MNQVRIPPFFNLHDRLSFSDMNTKSILGFDHLEKSII